MTEPHVAVLSQVQQFLDRQHGLYIDGRPGPAQSEKRLAIFDPATGQEIASTADANEADVVETLEALKSVLNKLSA